MKINKELIEKVAAISRLNLSEEEKEQFIKDFKDVLETFSKISKADTSEVDLSVQPFEVENVFREDKAAKGLSENETFQNTKYKEKGFFKGPRII